MYDKSAEDEAHRKDWARRAGLGFQLPEIRNPGRPAPQASKADSMVETMQEVVPYQATDDDLPIELFESPTEPVMEVK